MTSFPVTRGAGPAWLLLGAVLTLGFVVLVVPELRAPTTAAASVLSVLLVLGGVLVHRPQQAGWLLLALMLACWSVGSVLVALQDRISAPATVGVWCGQAVATGVIIHVVRSGGRPKDLTESSRLDLIIIATVLALVGLQIAATAASDSTNVTGLVVASIDVTLLGMLVRVTVARRQMGTSTYLAIAAACATIVYDVTSAVHGRRLALPGEPTQVLGIICVLLFAVAAWHPSMTTTFAPESFARTRRPSGSLLGLLPLVLVPAGLWWVADVSDAPGLPAWVVPVAGAVIAGLCLLRAAEALRASEHLAEHDPLTDLANRRGLAEAFGESPPPGGRSLMLIDLDDFKQVNDIHGHDIGDALLLHVRDRFVQATEGLGTVARMGGDEFVILIGTASADLIANRILRSLQSPFVIGALVLRVGASIGIADAEPGTSLAELLTRADVAMYAAKAAGGATVLAFHPDMRLAIARRFTLTSEIRQLLGSEAAGVGRLEVYYQPLVELRTGAVIGAEALVRWSHPQHGLLSPDAFLGIISNNHLDHALDSSVLRDVVTHLAQWRDQGRRAVPVSVNFTRDSLNDPRLAEHILSVLAESGIPTSQLHVEITEHDELPEDSPAARSLLELHRAGVEVHLDDYGTGYTSLDYLRRFPVQVLKLDRSVVTTVTEGDSHLVAGVNAMATALALDVLAEGIETVAQRERLVELGIRFGQGYLFSRPLPAQEYADTILGAARAPGDAPALPAPRLAAGLTTPA